MYRFSINDVSECQDCIIIGFTWISKTNKSISDLIFVYDNRWAVRFDYADAGGISSEECDLYNHIAELARTDNFRMLYVK
jgi:hypothetical protein